MYMELVMAPPAGVAILSDEEDEPVKLPFVTAAGKTTGPLQVSVCPFKFIIPFVCVNVPDRVKAVPSFKVCPALFTVKLFKVNAPVVKNRVFVILVPDTDKLDVVDPVIVPLLDAAGNVTAPVSVSVCAFNFTIPLVCV